MDVAGRVSLASSPLASPGGPALEAKSNPFGGFAAPAPVATTKEEQAHEAWEAVAKPVTEASFKAWYMANHQRKAPKKTKAPKQPAGQPAAKRQQQLLLPGAAVAAAPRAAPPAMGKGKRTAMLKAVASSVKAAIKAKKPKWHAGDTEKLNGTTVCDPEAVAQLFPGVTMTKKGVTTSFHLASGDIAAVFGASLKAKVATWSRTRRAFEKSYKTGSQEMSFVSAEGKYSTGTSTLTLKFAVNVPGGYSGGGFGGYGGGYGDDY
eukprot:COSAG01_NODE_7087_length_3359_cov_1.144479_3_plen_263_part_00